MSVSRFDNLEDFYAAEEKARNKADAKVWDWKKKPDNEDYFCKYSGFGFPIFMTVLQRISRNTLQTINIISAIP
jgi:hypothetical protein